MTDARHMIETLADALRMARDEIIDDFAHMGYEEDEIRKMFEEEERLKAIDAVIVQADQFLGVELVVAE